MHEPRLDKDIQSRIAMLEDLKALRPGSIWLHIKSGAAYEVERIRVRETTLELEVSYQLLDTPNAIGWLRSPEVFINAFKFCGVKSSGIPTPLLISAAKLRLKALGHEEYQNEPSGTTSEARSETLPEVDEGKPKPRYGPL